MNDGSNDNDNNNKKKSNSNSDNSNNGDNVKNGNEMDIRYNRYILKNPLGMINKAQFEFGLKCAGNSDGMKNNIDILISCYDFKTYNIYCKKEKAKGMEQ